MSTDKAQDGFQWSFQFFSGEVGKKTSVAVLCPSTQTGLWAEAQL